MKRFFSVVFFLTFFSFAVSAQQKPQYTQYIFNNFLLNPALSGIENYTDIKLGYRKQWSGITDAPQTTFLSANWSLGSEYLWKNPLSLPEKDADPMSDNYMQNYTASPPHHGMGALIVSDKAGPLSRIDANLTYAYHLKVGEKYNLALGVGAGLSSISIDVNKIVLENQNDPTLTNLRERQIKPDLNIGVWYYGPQLFLGASIQQLLPQSLNYSTYIAEEQGKEVAHYFVTGGYKFFIDDTMYILPSIMAKKTTASPMSIDMNAKFSVKDKFWVGGSYRKNDAFSALAGINLSKMFNLTYSYDFTTSELNTVSNGTHEFMLGIQL